MVWGSLGYGSGGERGLPFSGLRRPVNQSSWLEPPTLSATRRCPMQPLVTYSYISLESKWAQSHYTSPAKADSSEETYLCPCPFSCSSCLW